jgi:hypothetical protein
MKTAPRHATLDGTVYLLVLFVPVTLLLAGSFALAAAGA